MIYFIQDATAHLIKIGFTEGDADGRLRALQTGNPSGLILLHATDGTKADETELHRRFAPARVRGEWFQPVPELLAYLLELRTANVPAPVVVDDPWPLTIYLAGKINKHDWRADIVGGDILEVGGGCLDGLPNELLDGWPVHPNVIHHTHAYAGPYFVSCDHGCFHGDDSHGAISAVGESEAEHSGGDRPLVVAHCLAAIRRCDLLFAWIDSSDCYGTILEIGYAKALGKMVWIGGPRHFRDMWFAYQTATFTAGHGFGSAKRTLDGMLSSYRDGLIRNGRLSPQGAV